MYCRSTIRVQRTKSKLQAVRNLILLIRIIGLESEASLSRRKSMHIDNPAKISMKSIHAIFKDNVDYLMYSIIAQEVITTRRGQVTNFYLISPILTHRGI